MSFSTAGTRRRHEIDQHHYSVIQSRTVSPIEISNSSLSCPPTEEETFSIPLTRAAAKGSIRSLSSSSVPSIPTVVSQHSPIISDVVYQNLTTCSNCCHNFSTISNYNKHLPCPLRVNRDMSNTAPIILQPPKNVPEVLSILQHLPENDILKLCQSQDWCLPGYWPLVFPPRGESSGAEVFRRYTAYQGSRTVLTQFLKYEGSILLPRDIIINDPLNGVKSYLSENVLQPPPEFNTNATDSYFEVQHGQDIASNTNPPDDGGGSDDDGGGSDDDDGGGSDDDGGDNDDSDDISNDDESEDSDNDGGISFGLCPQPQPTVSTSSSFQAIRHLLPSNFDPGADGEGNHIRYYLS